MVDMLRSQLSREAAAVFDPAELTARARAWLVEHHYLLPRERDIRRLVIAAQRLHEQNLFRTCKTCKAAPRMRACSKRSAT
jgi:hypothetical protein